MTLVGLLLQGNIQIKNLEVKVAMIREVVWWITIYNYEKVRKGRMICSFMNGNEEMSHKLDSLALNVTRYLKKYIKIMAVTFQPPKS